MDISEKALERAKTRLGEKADKVTWIVSDINEFKPDICYDIGHDRATFHFLTADDQTNNYIKTAQQWISGFLIIGIFQIKAQLNAMPLKLNNIQKPLLKINFMQRLKK